MSTPLVSHWNPADHLDADIIVTATGLQLQALGGTVLSLDGMRIDPRDRFVYKAHMLEDVPNLFWCVGYTNASWTLRADITARATAKLLAHMASHGYTHASPHRGDEPMTEKPSWDIAAGYVQRSADAAAQIGYQAAVERAAELPGRRHSTTGSTASRSRWCSAAPPTGPGWRAKPDAAARGYVAVSAGTWYGFTKSYLLATVRAERFPRVVLRSAFHAEVRFSGRRLPGRNESQGLPRAGVLVTTRHRHGRNCLRAEQAPSTFQHQESHTRASDQH